MLSQIIEAIYVCQIADVPLEDCERQKTCRCNTECFPGQGCAKQCVGIPVEQLNNNSGGNIFFDDK